MTFDKDLPVNLHGQTLKEYIAHTTDWFRGWQGCGKLRNQGHEDYLGKRWKQFLEVYKLTGDSTKDFIAFLQYENELLWRDHVRWEKNNEDRGSFSCYSIQRNIRVRDAFERISLANGSTELK
jgi:hypothetical protein